MYPNDFFLAVTFYIQTNTDVVFKHIYHMHSEINMGFKSDESDPCSF